MKKADVLKHFTTQVAVRDALLAQGYQVSQPAISKWGENIPEVAARLLEKATRGALKFDESMYRSKSAA
ncbi:Cro/CI family transcriptional regulator [Haliea salexigens]|uniref:Cro/CI family transcriptional regulator n=1 Tax=Haliea salexigens TaxID=287487 RepID=UPI000400C013|nr:Cro/CI family transcriptional regulator [Haliea salexigens]